MVKTSSVKKVKKSSIAHKKLGKKTAKKTSKKSSVAKKSHKKAPISKKTKKSTTKRVAKPKPQVTFIPEPWSKVAKYKKIKKDGYYGYW